MILTLSMFPSFVVGCKNFTCLASFTDKPLASKCFKCRQRGKNSYLAKKANLVIASSSFMDDDGTSDAADDSVFFRSEATEMRANSMSGTSSVYTPATVVTSFSTLPTTSSTRKLTATFSSGTAKRPRLNSFVDADLSRSDGSTDCSTSSSSTIRSNRYISPPSSDSDGSIFEFSESRTRGSLIHVPLSVQTFPANHDKKPRIPVQFQGQDDEVLPAPVTRSTFMTGPLSSSPSNLQDRWQWSLDPQANPLNFLVLATQAMASPQRLAAPPAHIAAATATVTAPIAIIHSAPAAVTTTAAVSSADATIRAAAPLEDTLKENKLLAAVSAGLVALAALCSDTEKGDNKENEGQGLAAMMSSLALPLPDAAVNELELWVKKWSHELSSLPGPSSRSPQTL